jgi:RNA polymerase sigma-70 factor (sigma-E family)
MAAVVAASKPVVSPGREALADLYSSDYRDLVRLAAVLCDDPAGCEEIVQDAFVSALVHWNRIREPERAPAYLRSCVLNGARGRLRRRQTADRHPTAEPQPVLAADGSVVDRAVVVGALRRLPQRQREAVVLRYLLDLPDSAIAETLGVSVGAVKTHLHRGLANLNLIMEGQP